MGTADDLFSDIERAAWDSYRRARYLYRVSPLDTWPRVMAEGVTAGNPAVEGGQPAIWFFTDRKWAGNIANDVAGSPFLLIRFRKSAIPPDLVKWDGVLEFYAVCSFYAEIARIDPEDILGYDVLEIRPKGEGS